MLPKPFTKDEMVVFDSKTVRIESGPWKAQHGPCYVVEQADGHYVFANAHRLTRRPPVAGDRGRILNSAGEVHPYSPHTWVYADDDVILLKDRLGDYDYFITNERARVLATWEAI